MRSSRQRPFALALTHDGPGSARRDLAQMHRRYFSMNGITHHSPWEAIRDHNFAYVWDALHAGFPVNALDPMSGRHMLHEAAAVGDEEILQLLLEWEGCRPATRCLVGRDTALHFAAASGNWRAIDVLCCFGADPLATNRFAMAPLHEVTTVDAAKHLLRFGGNDKSKDTRGRTPAMLAAERGDADVATFLNEIALERFKAESRKERDMKRLKDDAEVARKVRLQNEGARKAARDRELLLRRARDEYLAWRRPAPTSPKARRKGKGAGPPLLEDYSRAVVPAAPLDTRKILGLG